ncbi:MAG TPA: hypothetical protein VGV63_02765 [Acidimicrobiales bacterium]|nr:hypothetical protein [Acidimicrobiales bacterium]
MGRWRRDSRIADAEAQERIDLAVAAVAEAAQRLTVRVERLERRVEDVEDAACAGLAPDRIDVLAARVDDLDLMAATHAELMEVRMHSARVMAELNRLAVEVRGEANGGWTATA